MNLLMQFCLAFNGLGFLFAGCVLLFKEPPVQTNTVVRILLGLLSFAGSTYMFKIAWSFPNI